MLRQVSLISAIVLTLCSNTAICQQQTTVTAMEHSIIYSDQSYYSSFPSLVVRPDGELMCAFRRAPSRRFLWGARGDTHTDSNSYLMLVRSRDNGKTWSSPELIFAHPMGGSQDPCMLQLKDGSIICTSYGWAFVPTERVKDMTRTTRHGNYAFLGGYVLRSDDGGLAWKGPFIPPVLPGEMQVDALGHPCATYNRGAPFQAANGNILWAVVQHDSPELDRGSLHLIQSKDKGEHWDYQTTIAADQKIEFNETSLIETKPGGLVAFMRTGKATDNAALARSKDGGKTWSNWEDAGFFGHPLHAVELSNGQVFLVYGYRRPPFGIRARILQSDMMNVKDAPEIVLRDDGGNVDLGYPWAVQLPDGKVMVAYYINIADGQRHIVATTLTVEGLNSSSGASVAPQKTRRRR